MTTHTKGILKPHDAMQNFAIKRYTPASSLQGVIQHYWIVRWDLPHGQIYESKTLAYPAVNIVVSDVGAHVGGPTLNTFSYDLTGSGVIYGVLFTPAGFSAFFGSSLKTLVDTRVAVNSIAALRGMNLFHIYQMADKEALGYLNTVFEKVSPQLSERAVWINQIFETIRSDRSLTKVAALCLRFNVSERMLQQWFRRYVGVSPKWAIMRYRMQDAADLLYVDPTRQLTDIALDLGYVDQAHFSRDFKRIVGVSPVAYRQSQQKHPA